MVNAEVDGAREGRCIHNMIAIAAFATAMKRLDQRSVQRWEVDTNLSP